MESSQTQPVDKKKTKDENSDNTLFPLVTFLFTKRYLQSGIQLEPKKLDRYEVWTVNCKPEAGLCLLKLNHINFFPCISCDKKNPRNWVVKYTENVLEKDILTRIQQKKPHLTIPTYCGINYILMYPATTLNSLVLESETQIDFIIKESFQLLFELHSLNIVHRDITPSNLVWTGDSVRFIDFGASRYENFSPILSSTAEKDKLDDFLFDAAVHECCPTTYAFACPYQLSDVQVQRHGASYPSLQRKKDVWSLGLVMFILGARNGNLLYSYKMNEMNSVSICMILLLRLASRIQLPTSSECKAHFQSIWHNLEEAQKRDTEAAKRERKWITDHLIIKKALTWDIQLRPDAQDLILLLSSNVCSPKMSSIKSLHTGTFLYVEAKKRKNYQDPTGVCDFDVEIQTQNKNKEDKEDQLEIFSISPPFLSLGKYPYFLCNDISNRYIKFSDRFILVDWMFEICLKYKLELQTWFMAVLLLDNYLLTTTRECGLQQFQLIGVMSIFLAGQCTDLKYFSKQDVYESINEVFSRKEIINLEYFMLSGLKYQIWQETPLFNLLKKRTENSFLKLTSESSLSELIFLECQKLVLFSQKKQIITFSSSTIEDYFGKRFEVEK